jgi:lipopolysaccharide export LptBFGC system permease protein LptF
MALSLILTPVAMLLELVICCFGIYEGYVRKKIYGYFFAVTFLLFAFFDLLSSVGVSADTLAILNVLAVVSALGGIWILVQEP